MRAKDGSFCFCQGYTQQKRTGYPINPFSQNLFNALLLLLTVIVRYLWNWSSGTWLDWCVENFKESVLDRELDYQILFRAWNESAFPRESEWCVNVPRKISVERYTNQRRKKSKDTANLGVSVRSTLSVLSQVAENYLWQFGFFCGLWVFFWFGSIFLFCSVVVVLAVLLVFFSNKGNLSFAYTNTNKPSSPICILISDM